MINVKIYEAPEINIKEILRHAGAKEMTAQTQELIEVCLDELKGKLTYKVCWSKFPVSISDNTIDMGFTKTESKDLAKNLKGCENVILFATCIGMEIDRLINKYSKLSPSKSVMYQAIGAERVESLCNLFNEEVKELEKNIKPRFSPGYGDLTLEFQKDVFKVLDCQRQIGLTLNESLLMSPSKSVTAIIGIAG